MGSRTYLMCKTYAANALSALMAMHVGYSLQRVHSSSHLLLVSLIERRILNSSIVLFSIALLTFLTVLAFLAILALGAATPASAAAVSPTSASSATRLARGRSYESKIHRDGLLEKFLVVGAVDGSASFLQCRVFDEGVSLSPAA